MLTSLIAVVARPYVTASPWTSNTTSRCVVEGARRCCAISITGGIVEVSSNGSSSFISGRGAGDSKGRPGGDSSDARGEDDADDGSPAANTEGEPRLTQRRRNEQQYLLRR